jgi:alkylhydroperoxidase family enzyme
LPSSAWCTVLISFANIGPTIRHRVPHYWIQCDEEEDCHPNVFPVETGLRYYVYRFLMQHALNYERKTRLSSRTLLRSTLNALIASDLDWNLIAAQFNLVRQLADADYRRLLCSDVHIATLFGLCLYLEEALAQSPEILTTYVESFTSIMPLGSVSRRRQIPKPRPPLQRLSGASLLATATYGSIIHMHHLPEQSKMVDLLAWVSLSPRLNDSDVLMAIRHLTKTEITTLLVKISQR